MFPMLFCLNSAHFLENQLVCDEQTDRQMGGPMDQWTDGQTDKSSYRDARTHLKKKQTKKERKKE